MRRRGKTIISVIVVILLLVCITAVTGYVLMKDRINMIGSWQRQIDITESISDEIREYLERAGMGEQIAVGDMVGNIQVMSELQISKDGNWKETVNAGSYDYAATEAQKAYEAAVKALIEVRLKSAYIESNRDTDTLIKDAIHMTLGEYLAKYGSDIMPAQDVLQAEYGLDCSYEVKDSNVMLTDIGECFFAADRNMLVVNYPNGVALYHKKSEPLIVEAQAAQIREDIKVHVGDTETTVSCLNQDYNNNLYISVNDLSVAFKGSSKAFIPVWTEKDGETNLCLEPVNAELQTDEDEPDDEDIKSGENADELNLTRRRMLITIDGTDYYYYVIPYKTDEVKDCYVNLGELTLSLNVDAQVYNNEVYINPDNEFDFSRYDFENSFLPYMTDSCIVADATSGEIYYSMNEDEIVSIASTSKLMTYFIIREAIEKGELSYNDIVTFSGKASAISKTGDGVVRVEPGDTASLEDVMKAMLICSSNECALALAEHYSGNEESFVELMNQKTVALGMSDEACFFNPHGLPNYGEDALTVKRQNHMSAADMLILVENILDKYPDITDITSIKKTNLASLNNFKAVNTNLLLYNVPGTVGLKTGTTDKAQSCLVTAYPIKDTEGETHYIVSICYGAENTQAQSYSSMILLRFGIQRFNAVELGIVPEGSDEQIPDNPEALIEAVLREARRNG